MFWKIRFNLIWDPRSHVHTSVQALGFFQTSLSPLAPYIDYQATLTSLKFSECDIRGFSRKIISATLYFDYVWKLLLLKHIAFWILSLFL